MSKRLLLIGGGGHCRSVLDSVLSSAQYTDIGVIDIESNVGKEIFGVPVIGEDGDLARLYSDGYRYAFVTVGSVGDSLLRVRLFNLLEDIGFCIPTIIDSTATVSEYVNLCNGVYIGKGSVVNVGVSVGKGAIINTGSIVEHDCIIGDFVHLAPGVVVCGETQIGRNTHIGASSVIKQQVKVGANTVIGMGSVVLKNIGDSVVAYGNPCREVSSR